jgi:hypothetical protein
MLSSGEPVQFAAARAWQFTRRKSAEDISKKE